MAVDVKQAVHAARDFLTDLVGEVAVDVRLEEVERKGGTWHIALSYTTPSLDRPAGPMAALADPLGMKGYPRHYKLVTIDEAGEALAMKILNPES